MKDKLKFQLVVSAVLIIVGCGLLIAGFSVPPIGVIDSSILVAYGETLTFVGALFGVHYSYKSRENNKDKDNEKH